MPSYYRALPIHKAAMDVTVRLDAVVQRLAEGYFAIRLRPCHAHLFERPPEAEAKQEESK